MTHTQCINWQLLLTLTDSGLNDCYVFDSLQLKKVPTSNIEFNVNSNNSYNKVGLGGQWYHIYTCHVYIKYIYTNKP